MVQRLQRLTAFLISWFFITFSLFSQDYVTVDEKFESSDFRNKIEILEDKGGILHINDVIKPQALQNFVRSTAEIPNLGISDSVFWIKIRIQNGTPKPKDVILEYSFSLVDSVDLYVPERNNEFKVYKSGNQVP
ncbi:MAG TPA: 7TM-DISM domain-containing protein, partial [Leptospiraceae bacterium]|nr:7TM-DISM domain-containing protein [Leptospiraceae bacterium]